MGNSASQDSQSTASREKDNEGRSQDIPRGPDYEGSQNLSNPDLPTRTPSSSSEDRLAKTRSRQSTGSVFLPHNSISRARSLKTPQGPFNSASIMSRRPNLDALRAYATVTSPSSSLPPNVLLFANKQCMVIFDAYPKAKYHFLVLPRYPFPGHGPHANSSIVKIDQLDDLKSLLSKAMTTPREEVLTAMVDTAREVEEMIRDEMVKTEGFEWKVDIGFHAIPSMKHIHLHVISGDRISPSMKTKKHYNSFRPDLGFFISPIEIERWLRQDEEFIKEHVQSLSAAGSLLDSTLSCDKCDEPFHNMPKLKAHLEKEWEQEKKRALEMIKRTGRQRSSEEDDLF